jgi:hypothetical protein
MPWCEDCAKFWNPNTIPPDGSCPTCGRVIGDPPDSRVPWHFWLLVAALVVYLGWRVVQGFQWLFDNGQTAWAIVAGAALVAVIGGAAAWNWWPQPDEAGAGDTGSVER